MARQHTPVRCCWKNFSNRSTSTRPLDISQTELARRIGVSYPRVNELVHGKRGMTPDTALRLERLLGMEAQFWLNLQLAWDLYHAMHSPSAASIQELERLPTLASN